MTTQSETTGFTFNGVANRMIDLETKANGAYYVALCWLAMTRDSGKGASRRLQDKLFGTVKPKVTSTFRNAWRIAGKSFAEGFHKGHRVTVDKLPLDEAVKFAVQALEDHKSALEVTSMSEYEAVCHHATKADVPAPQTETEPETPAETPAETVTATGETVPEPTARAWTDLAAAATLLSLEDRIALVQTLMADADVAKAIIPAPVAKAA